MPPNKGVMLKYSEECMEKAIEEVQNGMPVSTTAKKYGIPRVTLLYKVRGKTPLKRRMGPESYLSEIQEQSLVKWIIEAAKAGFPVTKEQLFDSVKKLVTELQIKNPFNNNRPGKHWFQCFLRRHPEIRTRIAQNLTSTRASITQEALDKWFLEVFNYLRENNYDNILRDSHRVFNADETAFFLNPKGTKVLAAKGNKTVYQQVNPDEKECLTVLMTGNAAGDMSPPMVIFKYQRIPREIVLSVPHSWGIGRSESGWMTGETFYEFISNIFYNWLIQNKIPMPVILFIDGHTSHLTYHTSKFCTDNGIILISLYPNATHLIQPMDVAIFRSLKGSWKSAVHQWRFENPDSPILRKVHFCPLLKKVIDENMAPSIFINGFRKCGLVPWNPAAVCLRKNVTVDCVQKKNLIKELENGIIFLEKFIPKEKLSLFKNVDVWSGNVEDTSLFLFYKKVVMLHRETKNEINANESLTNTDNSVNESIAINQQNTTNEIEEVLEKHIENISELEHQRDENMANVEKNNNRNAQLECSLQEIPDKCTPTSSVRQRPENASISPDTHLSSIPSPFKRALFWPEPKMKVMKKRKTERIPAVVSSKDWQKYYENKEKKKRELEEAKARRVEERKKKQEQKLLVLQKQKTIKKLKSLYTKRRSRKVQCNDSSSSDEEWCASESSTDEIISKNNSDAERANLLDNFEDRDLELSVKEGDYLLVKFTGEKTCYKYVCVVQRVLGEEYEIMPMNIYDNSHTIFTINENVEKVIKHTEIINKLPIPKLILTRDKIKYQFPMTILDD